MGHNAGQVTGLAIGAVLCKNLKTISEIIDIKLTDPETGHVIEGATVSFYKLKMMLKC
jgi:hypothetical protein